MTQGELFSRIVWPFFDGIRGKKVSTECVTLPPDQWEFISVGKLTSPLPQLIKNIHFQPNTYLSWFFCSFLEKTVFQPKFSCKCPRKYYKGESGEVFWDLFSTEATKNSSLL